MSNRRVAVLSTLSGPAFDRVSQILAENDCEVVIGPSFSPEIRRVPYPAAEMKALIEDAAVIYIASNATEIGSAALTPLPAHLRGIVTSSIGYNCIDVDECTRHGILVSNSPVETNFEGVVQHTVLLALTLRRRLDAFRAWARDGQPWVPYDHPEPPLLFDARTTVGVVGFGRIGYRVARIFRESFHTNVLVFDPYVAEDKTQQIDVSLVDSMDELLAKSDVVTIHVFLSDETRHLIGARELALMKPTSILINTARGPVIDQAALLAGLREEQIAAVGLDVAEIEPMQTDHPLLSMDNVIVTPHIAGVSAAHILRGAEFAAWNAVRLIDGQVPKIIANPEALDNWVGRFGIGEARYGGTHYYRH